MIFHIPSNASKEYLRLKEKLQKNSNPKPLLKKKEKKRKEKETNKR